MRNLSPAQYKDLWPLDRGVSLLRRAKQYVWAQNAEMVRKARKSGSPEQEMVFLEAFDILDRLQGERLRDVMLERYLEYVADQDRLKHVWKGK